MAEIAERGRRIGEEQLRLYIGAAHDEQLTIGEDIRAEQTTPAPAALDDLLGKAAGKRLDFRVLDKGIAAKEKQRESEKAGKVKAIMVKNGEPVEFGQPLFIIQ